MLKTTYDTIKATYENFSKFKWTPEAGAFLEELWPPPGRFIPVIPLKPNKPEFYLPKYQFGLNSAMSSEGQADYQNWGGWGFLTMGLLSPLQNSNHSYGTLGQEGVLLNKGIHYASSFMLSSSTEYKYTIVSVVPSINYASGP